MYNMENAENTFWLYFKEDDRTFSHSCNVRHPERHRVGFIEVEHPGNLTLGWEYTLDEDNVTVNKGAKLPESPRE
jgi:hypothetical protein